MFYCKCNYKCSLPDVHHFSQLEPPCRPISWCASLKLRYMVGPEKHWAGEPKKNMIKNDLIFWGFSNNLTLTQLKKNIYCP